MKTRVVKTTVSDYDYGLLLNILRRNEEGRDVISRKLELVGIESRQE